MTFIIVFHILTKVNRDMEESLKLSQTSTIETTVCEKYTWVGLTDYPW